MLTPNEIKIGTVLVPVGHLGSLGAKQELGEYDEFPAGKISLCPGLPPQQEVMTLFHEILHAISAQYGLDLKERQVRVLEQTISSLFKDNPKFTKLYLKHL